MKTSLTVCWLLMATAAQAKSPPAPPPQQPAVEPNWSNVRQESEAALKASLIDPESAQITWTKGFTWGFFKPMFDRHYYGWVACGQLNARNRMGGYVGSTAFVVVYDGGVKYKEIDSLVEQPCSASNVTPQPELLDVPTSGGNSVSIADELQKLAHLRDTGVLSEAEFQTQKTKLLAESPK